VTDIENAIAVFATTKIFRHLELSVVCLMKEKNEGIVIELEGAGRPRLGIADNGYWYTKY